MLKDSQVKNHQIEIRGNLCRKFCGKQNEYYSILQYKNVLNRDELDVTCFIISLFAAQHVSDVNTSILRSLRLI